MYSKYVASDGLVEHTGAQTIFKDINFGTDAAPIAILTGDQIVLNGANQPINPQQLNFSGISGSITISGNGVLECDTQLGLPESPLTFIRIEGNGILNLNTPDTTHYCLDTFVGPDAQLNLAEGVVIVGDVTHEVHNLYMPYDPE